MTKTIGQLALEWSKTADLCCVKCAEEGFIAGYQAAAPQWISVKDRLPEEDVTVLAFVNYSVNDARLERIDSAAYRGKLWLMGSDIYSERFITHWMPLPEPPKEEG